MTLLVFDPTTGKYRSFQVTHPPAPRDGLPPIWPRTPEWYPKDDRYRGGEK